MHGNVAKPGQKLFLSIRPEALWLQKFRRPVLHAKLVLREFLGQIQRLHAALPDGTQIRVSTLGSLHITPTAGAALAFAYDPAQIIVYPAPWRAFRYTIVFGALALLALFLLYPLSLVLDASLRVNGTGTFTLATTRRFSRAGITSTVSPTAFSPQPSRRWAPR